MVRSMGNLSSNWYISLIAGSPGSKVHQITNRNKKLATSSSESLFISVWCSNGENMFARIEFGSGYRMLPRVHDII